MGKTILKTNFTEDERYEFQELTLKMIREKKYGYEIAEALGISEQEVSRYKKRLIKANRITQREIDEYKEQRDREELRKKRLMDPKVGIIKAMLLDGKYDNEIADAVSYHPKTVKRIEDELIEQKQLSTSKIEAARKERQKNEKEAKEQNKPELRGKLKNRYLRMLKAGISSHFIAKSLNINKSQMYRARKKSKISDEEIKNARAKREEKNERKIIELYEVEGLTLEEIIPRFKSETPTYIKRTFQGLKKEGKMDETLANSVRMSNDPRVIERRNYKGIHFKWFNRK